MTVFPSLSFILLLTCVLAAQQSPLPKTSPQYTDPVSETVLENKHKLLEFPDKQNTLLERVFIQTENSDLETKLEERAVAIQQITIESGQIIVEQKAKNQAISEELAKRTKEVKDIKDELSRKMEAVTNASNTSNSSREGSKETLHGRFHHSRLQSLDAIHQEAAEVTNIFLNSLPPHLPKRCVEWFRGSLESVQKHMETVSWQAFQAKRHLPHGSEASQKMGIICTSLMFICRDVKEMKRCDNSTDFEKHSSKCVELVEEMITIFQTIIYIDIPLLPLMEFAKFLTSFVGFLNSHTEAKFMDIYEGRMRELNICSVRASQ